MDSFKFEIFLKEHGFQLFGINALKGDELILAKEKIINSMGISSSENVFQSCLDLLPKRPASSEQNQILNILSGNFSNDVYLFWKDDEIDKINIKDLVQNWNYIWYPESDDGLIFFEQGSKKVLLITHWGAVYHN